MLKLFTLLLSLIERFFAAQDRSKIKQEGRQEMIEEIKDAVDERVAKAEAAVSVSDPERDERLRSRFDRSRPGE